MKDRQNYSTAVADLPSLALTLNILLDKQEKDWGCFQVKKEAEFYALYIPSLLSLKLYKNPKSENYKGYWRDSRLNELPDLKNRAEKPDIYLTNRSKQVEEIKQIKKSGLIKTQRTLKKQRIIDVKYRYNSCPEIHRLNQVIANLIRDRVQNSVTFTPGLEVMPLVLATEVMDD